MTMLEALLQAAGAFAPFLPQPAPAEGTDFVTKVLEHHCWREGCSKPESSPLGLCVRHLEEAKSWT